MPDAPALVGPTGVQLLVFFASVFYLLLAVESPSLFHLCSVDFYVLGDVH